MMTMPTKSASRLDIPNDMKLSSKESVPPDAVPRRRTSPCNSSTVARISLRSSASGDSANGAQATGQRGGRVSNQHQHKFFVDAEQMKEKVRRAAVHVPYDVCDFYHRTGIWQAIARHPFFDNMTLLVIVINALWIAVDTDMNSAEMLLEAAPVFQVAEHLFCLYFSLEWCVRFMSFAKKRNALRDAWFVFDSTLVFMMVMETWVMSIVCLCAGNSGSEAMGNASIMRMARLLRLSRMARMARLCKAMPELLILIKAMAASVRSCFFVFFLLAMITYIFGIAFRQLTAGTAAGDQHFESVLQSMHTLWIDGTLLDNCGGVVSALWAESVAYVFLFYVFVLLSALTLLNMLIGVLCEVVSAVAATEKETLTVKYVRDRLLALMHVSGFDADQNGEISKEEFSKLLEYPEACNALTGIGVDIYSLIDNIDFIFAIDDANFGEDGEKGLSFEEFMSLILDHRGNNTATLKDIVELRKFIARSNRKLKAEIDRSEDRHIDRLSGVLRCSEASPTPSFHMGGWEQPLLSPPKAPPLRAQATFMDFPPHATESIQTSELGLASKRTSLMSCSDVVAPPRTGLVDEGLIDQLDRRILQSTRAALLPELSEIKALLRCVSAESSEKLSDQDEPPECSPGPHLRQSARPGSRRRGDGGTSWVRAIFPDCQPGQPDHDLVKNIIG